MNVELCILCDCVKIQKWEFWTYEFYAGWRQRVQRRCHWIKVAIFICLSKMVFYDYNIEYSFCNEQIQLTNYKFNQSLKQEHQNIETIGSEMFDQNVKISLDILTPMNLIYIQEVLNMWPFSLFFLFTGKYSLRGNCFIFKE